MRAKPFLLLVAAILIFFLAVSFAGFLQAIRPPRITSDITPADLGLRFEPISFRTDDGILLRGWFIPRQATGHIQPADGDATPTLILLHGYPADKGNILPALAALADTYHLLFFDFRYFGESDGAYSTAGAREIQDVRAAVRFLEERGVSRIGLWGFSVGGAVALMAAPELPAVRAVVADSSYARLDLMAPELYRIPLASRPLGALTGFWTRMFLGIHLRTIAPAESARHLRIPALIIHSTDDRTIPFSNATLIREGLAENPRADFWFDENLAHGQLRANYLPRIRAFFAVAFAE